MLITDDGEQNGKHVAEEGRSEAQQPVKTTDIAPLSGTNRQIRVGPMYCADQRAGGL